METQVEAQLERIETEPEEPCRFVACRIVEADNTEYEAAITLGAHEPLANVSAALLNAAIGATATHGPILQALFRDLIETGRALANAIPAELQRGIRVSDIDMVLRHARPGAPQLIAIPGLSQPVAADVVRAVLAAAGAW